MTGATAAYRGSMLGLAAGDAVGTAVEFEAPGSFSPVVDLTGGGPFGLRPGEWTEDLTEEGEYGLAPYAEHLEGLESRRLSIPDLGVPAAERMRVILDTPDGRRSSPETREQRRLVEDWQA